MSAIHCAAWKEETHEDRGNVDCGCGWGDLCIPLVDIRGLPFDDPKRKTAYPDEGFPPLGESIRYIHLQSSRWYFDASQPENSEEAERAIAELVTAAETWDKPYSKPYAPFRVVVDNYGGTIIGRRP